MSLAGEEYIRNVIMDNGLPIEGYTGYRLFQKDGVSLPDGLNVPVTNTRTEVLRPFDTILKSVVKLAVELELDIATSIGIPLENLNTGSQWSITGKEVRNALTASARLPGGIKATTGNFTGLIIHPVAPTEKRGKVLNLTSHNRGKNYFSRAVENTQIVFGATAELKGATHLARCAIAFQLRENTAKNPPVESRYLLLGKVVRYN